MSRIWCPSASNSTVCWGCRWMTQLMPGHSWYVRWCSFHSLEGRVAPLTTAPARFMTEKLSGVSRSSHVPAPVTMNWSSPGSRADRLPPLARARPRSTARRPTSASCSSRSSCVAADLMVAPQTRMMLGVRSTETSGRSRVRRQCHAGAGAVRDEYVDQPCGERGAQSAVLIGPSHDSHARRNASQGAQIQSDDTVVDLTCNRVSGGVEESGGDIAHDIASTEGSELGLRHRLEECVGDAGNAPNADD